MDNIALLEFEEDIREKLLEEPLPPSLQSTSAHLINVFDSLDEFAGEPDVDLSNCLLCTNRPNTENEYILQFHPLKPLDVKL